MMADQDTENSLPSKKIQGSHTKQTKQHQKQPRATKGHTNITDLNPNNQNN
jgi:hypothetical protein